MKPTDEQLRDPGWWDREAPEGATHYEEEGRIRKSSFMKKQGDNWYFWWSRKQDWIHDTMQPDPENLIPRPTAWQGEGWPPVGEQCEVFHNGRWLGATAVGEFGEHKKCMVCAPDGGGFYGFYSEDIRPLRTKEEVERDRVTQQARDAITDSGCERSVEAVTGLLYDTGMLRKPMDREKANKALSEATHPYDVYFPVAMRSAILDALGF